MPTEKNSKVVNGNPVEITSTNDKPTDAQLQKNYEASRAQFKEKYGVDFNNVKTRAKREKDVKSTLETVGEGKKHSKEELQQDFTSLKEAFVAKGASFKFSDLEAYSKELTKEGFLEPEKPAVKNLTKKEQEWEKTKKGMAAGMGELKEKIGQMKKAEATHESQGTSSAESYNKEQFKEYQESNEVLRNKYGIDLANNTKMTAKQVNEKLVSKLKEALEPEGSSPEQVQENKAQFKKDLDRYKSAFTDRFSAPDKFSTISRLENSEYLQQTREQTAKTTAESAKKPSRAKEALKDAQQHKQPTTQSTFAERTNQSRGGGRHA